MAKFEKMRVSLARDEPGGLLDDIGNEPQIPSRTDFLTSAFGSPHTFLNRSGWKVNFIPIEAPSGFAAGFFAKERPVPLKHADLSPYLAENYEPALFVISLDKAQVIWMESSAVGSPKSILESFFSYLLKKTELNQWQAFVRYFETKEDYWAAVEKYRSQITKIVFRYVPPNAFEGEELAQRYHTAVQQQAQNEILEETFKGQPGKMDPTAEMMRANAEIAEQGAGERELRGRGNKLLYSSGRGRVTDVVDDDQMPSLDQPSLIRQVILRLFNR
ncbi:hypothetical protein [Qipengyuania marisflavi]|uniref:Uncharacterized protein n=1 Tax=Qipengyuania marisflavi TaxID=2486356 RepID=A0A5S3NY83_9SPHN|nr:hypothetical protein [Qipengyuania marisflavi]TMM45344.1 hypothetical protein FEV51_12780 [Qipengyuania marisflavi]